jgi:hypothetical protein
MEMGIDTPPYENGVSLSIPISIWGTRWNGYPFLYGDPRIEMDPRFQTGTVQSLTRFQIEFVSIWGPREKSQYGNVFYMGITVSIW